jgi:hypothetical protein
MDAVLWVMVHKAAIVVLFACTFVCGTRAQNIGINVDGSAPDGSALLDVSAAALPANAKRGLLIPRMTTAERTAIAAPATGLLVFDSTTNGFWYYDGTVWTSLINTSGAWSTTGNAGMALGTNFLGTTDNNQLEVRVDNERSGFLTPSGTTTSWGHRALMVNTGTNNTAVGKNALTANTTANNNTALGSQALATNTTGGQNTALGSQALNLNLSTSNNTAVGFRAMNVTVASDNTAVGSEAMLFNGTGADNTAVGSDALRVNVLGAGNTAVGSSALYTNVADGNTAVGSTALFANTSGIYNVAVGAEALEDNSTGGDNTAVGAFALWNNTVGVNNTAIGFQAMGINSAVSADYNTAVGYQAGIGITNQNYNTTIGYQAGLSGAANSTIVGANIVQNAAGYTNATALGYGTVLDGSNRVRLGNNAVTSIGGYAGWTTLPSDARYKRDVREDVSGLDFILKLRPVTYHVDVARIVQDLGEDITVDSLGHRIPREQPEEILQARREKETIRYTGFIAQEVDSAAKAVGYDFSGVDKVTDSDRMLGLRYAEFVVPLVKAVQQQQMLIDEQRVLIQQLLERLNTIESSIAE